LLDDIFSVTINRKSTSNLKCFCSVDSNNTFFLLHRKEPKYVDFLQEIVQSGNTEDFENEFQGKKDYIWPEFIDEALQTTSTIDAEIKKLLEK